MTALRLKRHGRLALGRALPVSVALALAAAVSAQAAGTAANGPCGPLDALEQLGEVQR